MLDLNLLTFFFAMSGLILTALALVSWPFEFHPVLFMMRTIRLMRYALWYARKGLW